MKKAKIILMLLLCIGAMTNIVLGQGTLKTVKVYVIDEGDTPMPGAYVHRSLVPSQGVTTDLDGIATFETFLNSNLSVSYLGYYDVTFKVGSANNYTIVLKTHENSYYVVPMAADEFIQVKNASKLPISLLLKSLGAEVKSISN
ncbi:MAG: carboxypeptidase-like regulatory domain-containing protein [Sphingobacterium sp.]|jgi:hypothetical protein|nr:carboxypeptidase-like regulatory domain-containing protein [Sphingobacterium sp.]